MEAIGNEQLGARPAIGAEHRREDVDERLARIGALLEAAAARGVCRYGLHKQDNALITCFVINPMQRDHMHFIDGASGGYAVAASRMTGKSLSAVSVTP